MAKEFAEHEGRKVVERTIRGNRTIAAEDDDIGIPYTSEKGRIYSPLFPYESFANRRELAKKALEQGVSLKKRR